MMWVRQGGGLLAWMGIWLIAGGVLTTGTLVSGALRPGPDVVGTLVWFCILCLGLLCLLAGVWAVAGRRWVIIDAHRGDVTIWFGLVVRMVRRRYAVERLQAVTVRWEVRPAAFSSG